AGHGSEAQPSALGGPSRREPAGDKLTWRFPQWILGFPRASMSEKRTGDSGPPAQMRIRLKYADVPTFIERFAPNVTRGGLFIASRTPKPVGTTVRFELPLADGTTTPSKGEGVAAWVREFDPENPGRPHGMGVRFSRLDAESRQLIEKVDAFKRARGLRDDGVIPQPAPAPAPAPR